MILLNLCSLTVCRIYQCLSPLCIKLESSPLSWVQLDEVIWSQLQSVAQQAFLRAHTIIKLCCVNSQPKKYLDSERKQFKQRPCTLVYLQAQKWHGPPFDPLFWCQNRLCFDLLKDVSSFLITVHHLDSDAYFSFLLPCYSRDYYFEVIIFSLIWASMIKCFTTFKIRVFGFWLEALELFKAERYYLSSQCWLLSTSMFGKAEFNLMWGWSWKALEAYRVRIGTIPFTSNDSQRVFPLSIRIHIKHLWIMEIDKRKHTIQSIN